VLTRPHQAVDKVGRTARRTLDTHVKHAISKPRVSTTLRRMTALINFTSDLPAIVSTAEKPDLQVQQLQEVRYPSENPTKLRPVSPHPIVSSTYSGVFGLPLIDITVIKPRSPNIPSTKPMDSFPPPSHADSATESDSEQGPSVLDHTKGKGKASLHSRSSDLSPKPLQPQSVVPSRQISPLPPHGQSQTKGPSSDSESSPLRPAKKAKPRVSSSDDDSEEERKKRVAQLKNGAAPKRGARQPIKRGGKRF